ncbi:acyltransferase family protein [Salinimicrobium sp. GXAS 041]|uniref:acyltransferase family protein n=1 Tax=Salinimicrobium sp. GXAS 041 TaxID=3400806 RepID=UPI003C765545
MTVKTAAAFAVAPQNRERYLSLDVLRGLTIALMILVNTPGSWSTIYAPFKHAAWHGFTITDLVFPTFLFVVGNAMSFSMKKFSKQRDAVFLKKVFKRTFLIFIIGLLLNAFPFFYRSEGELVLKDFTSLRIMGVLQRIALCYLFASLIIKYLRLKGAVIASAILLLGYWAIMYFFGDPGAPYSLEGNAALKFDHLIFSPENLYRGFGIAFDPEGLLSTLPAIVNVIAGYLAGVYIQQSRTNLRTVLFLVAGGITFVLLGQIWDLAFPINKPVWTSSYVLLTVGWDLVLIGSLIWFIEIANVKKWTYFFEVFGRNPLFIYVMSGGIVMLMAIIVIGETSLKSWLYQNLFLNWLTDYNASLLFAVTYVFLLWLLGYWMDRKKIYIKV